MHGAVRIVGGRGGRRRRGYDRGFVLSDHADWPSLVQTIEDCGAKRVLATHGSTEVLVEHLKQSGVTAENLATPYGDEGAEEDSAEATA